VFGVFVLWIYNNIILINTVECSIYNATCAIVFI